MGRFKSFITKMYGVIKNISQKDIDFIQMRLPVSKITKDFENNLKNKIKDSLINAEIRQATGEDINHLIDLHNRAWHSTPMPYRPLTKEKLNEILNDESVIFLIARVDGKDSGFALIYFTSKDNLVGVIAGLGILPELQRNGLGTILGIASWDLFKKKGVKELRCKVYKDNITAYNFIRDLGFEEYDEDFVQWKIF
ncbi:MAG: GNAT family N-acetyltransferase [Promethearchaeota archaeon]